MKVDLIDIILLIVFAQLISLSFYLFFLTKKSHASTKILAVFLLSKALCISGFLSFRLWDYTFNYFPHILFFGTAFALLWGPSLYLYTQSLTQPGFVFSKKHLAHSLPFLFVFIYFLLNYHIYDAESKRTLITTGSVMPMWGFKLMTWFQNISLFFYLFFSLFKILKYRKVTRTDTLFISQESLSWLYFVVIGFSLKWGLDLWYTVEFNSIHSEPMLPLILSRLDLIVFVNVMIFKGMKHTTVFSLNEVDPEIKRISLSRKMGDKYLAILHSHMEKEKYYLDMDLSLMELAHKTGIPYRSLSEIINNRLGQNFFDFVNSYRIKEAERIFADPNSQFQTILEVMYEVGFNNKTSFNAFFKKSTGMTPTEFKRSCSVRFAFSG